MMYCWAVSCKNGYTVILILLWSDSNNSLVLTLLGAMHFFPCSKSGLFPISVLQYFLVRPETALVRIVTADAMLTVDVRF